MKFYLWQLGCAIFCAVLLIFRGFPGWIPVIIGGAIIVGSCVLTYIGNKKAVDDMWWRIAGAAIAILVIGLSQ